MRAFRVPAAAALSPLEVSDAVFASAVVDPQAFVALVTDADHPDGVVTLCHRLQRFEAQLGVPTPFDGNGYAFYGDIVDGQAPPVVQWPANAFHQASAPARVPSRAVIDNAFATDPNVQMFDPLGAADPDAEVVRVRRVILVPFRCVRILLAGPLTPREAWIQLAGALHNDNRQVSCRPLIDWLRYILVREAAGQPSRIAQPRPMVPLATPPLVQRRWALVTRDLPLLSGASATATGNAIAAGINDLVSDNRQNRLADEARRVADSAKTPEKYFGPVGTAKLLRICQVANSASLPQVWKDLASAPKKQDLVTFQQAFDNMALTLNMPGMKVPITPDMGTKLRTLAFEMTNDDDLSTGIHPFVFSHMNQEEITEACVLQERYLLIQQGLGAPTLAEAAAFTRSGKVKLPRTLTEATISYGKWRIALHVLLGAAHPMTRTYDSFWQAWNAGQNFLLNIRTRTPGLFPALTVRWIQLRTSLWFSQQALMNGTVQAPEFVTLLNEIRLQKVWEPFFPEPYLAAPSEPALPAIQVPPALPQVQPPFHPQAQLPAAPGTMSGNPPRPPQPGGRGSLERKTSPLNQVFQPFVDLALRIRDVLRRAGPTNRVPNNASGTEMCLSYHIKGMCNTNCARRGDHRDHTPDEDQALHGWCQRHYTPE